MTPDYKISAGSADITEPLAKRLISLSITDEAGWVSDALTIVLDNRDEELEVPSRGKKLSVLLGYKEAALEPMGEFIVDEVEVSFPPAQITITGRSADTFTKDAMSGIKTPKSKSWHEVSYGEIVAAIAAAHGLKPRIEPELAELLAEHLDQTGESDIAFLNRIVEEAGGFVKIAGGTLIVAEAGSLDIPPAVLKPSDISSWRCRIAERGKYSSCQARYRDRKAAEEKSVTIGRGEPVYRMPYLYASAAYASRAAKAKLAELVQGVHTLELKAIGNPAISTETPLSLAGVSAYVDGDWVAKSCTHQLDAGGYTTSINATKRSKT